jgi:hypothetical protein
MEKTSIKNYAMGWPMVVLVVFLVIVGFLTMWGMAIYDRDPFSIGAAAGAGAMAVISIPLSLGILLVYSGAMQFFNTRAQEAMMEANMRENAALMGKTDEQPFILDAAPETVSFDEQIFR